MTERVRSRIAVIGRDECLDLLAGEVIGRLATVTFGAPHVVPVNYVLDGESIVFRTDPGTKHTQGPRGRASFEIDSFDRVTRTGWSVVVGGRLEEVTPFDGAELERLRALPVDPWADGEKAHWMRLVSDRITGRRIVAVPDAVTS